VTGNSLVFIFLLKVQKVNDLLLVRKTLFTFVPGCSKNIVYVRSRTFERHIIYVPEDK